MKNLQFILIIFCLGLFLIPKDNFYAQASQENCCSSKSSDCCKSDQDSNHKSSSKNTCNDDCCSFCMTCHSFIENFSIQPTIALLSYFSPNKDLHYTYANPYLSDGLKEIWQPPKLG
ncbi:MAG: hypothetical protein KBS61_02545 [Chryseobacterium sp.]|nr:hypothetical protein [Candidatus Chryseobacterium enterohippi]